MYFDWIKYILLPIITLLICNYFIFNMNYRKSANPQKVTARLSTSDDDSENPWLESDHSWSGASTPGININSTNKRVVMF